MKTKNPLLLICLLTGLLLTSCATTNKISIDISESAKNQKPPQGKSLVYVYRTSALGFAVGLNVSANNKMLATLFPKRFYLCTLDPGKYIFTGHGENEDDLVLTTEPNKKYYIEAKPRMGFASARIELTLHDQIDGNNGVQKCKMVGSTDGISPMTSQNTTSEKTPVKIEQPLEPKALKEQRVQTQPQNETSTQQSFLPPPRKRAGMSVGLSTAKWSGDDQVFAQSLSTEMSAEGFSGFQFNSKARIGLSLGAFIDYPVKNGFSIQPELNYVQKGATFSGNGTYYDSYDSYSVSTDMTYQMDYLGCAFLLKQSFTNENAKPYLFVGPGFDYLISSRIKVNVTVEGESDSNSQSVDVDKKFDTNLNFGGGIDFSNQIRLDVRYTLGLMPVIDDAESGGFKLKNSVIGINFVACF